MAQQVADEKKQAAGNEEAANALFVKISGQPFAAQASFFLNVFYDSQKANGEAIYTIFDAFLKGANNAEQKGSISSIAFMKVLNDLEDSIEQCKKDVFPQDGPGISKKFNAAGIKKKGEIPLIGALLAIFNQNIFDMESAPGTPALGNLRKQEANLASVKNEEEKLVAKKAAIEAEIEKMNQENAKPIKVMKKREELKKVENELDNGARKVAHTKNVKAAEKLVKEANELLAKENQDGTEATNWFKEACGKGHTKYYHFKLD